MDVAINLVESYLRLNGYLTLSEFEIQGRSPNGGYETLTDVDIIGIRFPGDIFAAETEGSDGRLLLIHDDALMLRDGQIDVIIGEVKQGEAEMNEALTRREVLHSVLRRLEWLYDGKTESVLRGLQHRALAEVSGRGGTPVRTRLVAFGRSDAGGLHTIPIAHVLSSMLEFMDQFDDVLRPAQFREPAPALLRLMIKAGLDVTPG